MELELTDRRLVYVRIQSIIGSIMNSKVGILHRVQITLMSL